MRPDLSAAFEHLLPWIRSQFPQIDNLRNGEKRIYLDNAAGTLVPQTVADAMADAALFANPQPERSWPAGPATKREHERTRQLLADFLNAGDGDSLFLSESTTASLYKLREALEPQLFRGNVVVTDCDHLANISAWEWRPRWEVRRAGMLPDGSLDLDHLASLLDDSTRVVAVTMASNGLGTTSDLSEIVRLVRRESPKALVVVDAVHGAPHLPIDVAELGADALAFSTYKLFGPNAGVLWLRSGLLERLSPFHVEPHTDPGTLMEWGTLNNVTVAGIRAALEYLLRIGERLEPSAVGQWAQYPRGRRLFKVAMNASQQYEALVSSQVLMAMAEMSHVRLYGISEATKVEQRVPTFAFEAKGIDGMALEQQLWAKEHVQAAYGSHYSAAVTRGMGKAGLTRASFAHYNDAQDVATFLAALRRLSQS
jgi:selenocysteine lyase/cysteine desulfurase